MPYPIVNPLDRPHVLTEETQLQIVKALKAGNYLDTACRYAGTTKDVFYYWKNLYEDGVKHAQVYADFFNAVQRAMAVAEVDALDVIHSAVTGWQSSAWFLERRYPKRWGRKDRVPDPPKPSKPFEQMTQEEFDEYKRKLGAI